MKIIEETQKNKRKIEAKEMKILGVAINMNNDGVSYYVAFDGTDYYLFTGDKCSNPVSYFTDYERL